MIESEINILRVRLPQMCQEPREWQKEDVQDRWGTLGKACAYNQPSLFADEEPT